jgi:predicted nuclease of predicted toxin-antitoxin system
MRFLADAGISPDTVAFLISLGHDAVHVRTLAMQRALDGAIVDHARTDDRIVLTFDLDFGDILALGGLDCPSVVLFRLSDERPSEVNRRLVAVITEQRESLESGALILVEHARYRVRRLPIA